MSPRRSQQKKIEEFRLSKEKQTLKLIFGEEKHCKLNYLTISTENEFMRQVTGPLMDLAFTREDDPSKPIKKLNKVKKLLDKKDSISLNDIKIALINGLELNRITEAKNKRIREAYNKGIRNLFVQRLNGSINRYLNGLDINPEFPELLNNKVLHATKKEAVEKVAESMYFTMENLSERKGNRMDNELLRVYLIKFTDKAISNGGLTYDSIKKMMGETVLTLKDYMGDKNFHEITGKKEKLINNIINDLDITKEHIGEINLITAQQQAETCAKLLLSKYYIEKGKASMEKNDNIIKSRKNNGGWFLH